MRFLFALTILSFSLPTQAQQIPAQEFTDPIALLQAVSRNYADAVDTFRLESIKDYESSSDLNHQWNRTYSTAIKGPGSQYRIEVRTGFGSLMQVSDGTSEWTYQVESNSYVKRPLPPDWPKFPKLMDMTFHGLKEAWEARTFLEDEALGYKRATMMPAETIVIDGHRYACYVLRASSEDSVRGQNKDYRGDVTFWIDKQALIFRKIRQISDGTMMVSKNLHLPNHSETTETYPVAEINPKTTAEMFRFSPPADAKEVATLEPDFGGMTPPAPAKAQMAGQLAPAVTFAAADGKKIDLASFRGKPVLIDFWATWCGPCLVSMPTMNKIYTDTKGKGLQIVSFDQNNNGEDADLYLKRHHYEWTNYHDGDRAVFKALKGEGIPLVVLIDANGKIVYFDFGGNEVELRKQISSLGPEFATVSSSH